MWPNKQFFQICDWLFSIKLDTKDDVVCYVEWKTFQTVDKITPFTALKKSNNLFLCSFSTLNKSYWTFPNQNQERGQGRGTRGNRNLTCKSTTCSPLCTLYGGGGHAGCPKETATVVGCSDHSDDSQTNVFFLISKPMSGGKQIINVRMMMWVCDFFCCFSSFDSKLPKWHIVHNEEKKLLLTSVNTELACQVEPDSKCWVRPSITTSCGY